MEEKPQCEEFSIWESQLGEQKANEFYLSFPLFEWEGGLVQGAQQDPGSFRISPTQFGLPIFVGKKC